ncbi:Pectinesterase [Heracleum sosnowskyi]|uniref:pectinesterase n=1 Tax=Heracleum sosnowskyi TaxID=360622 RepID=A0AAD8JD84_9APIA|nr:Pectinesterase [Heracleum sosnowskyi]
MDKTNKRYAIIGFSSLALVAIVLVVTIGNQNKITSHDKHITLSEKTLLDICHGVDFRDACVAHLPFRKDHDPRHLLRTVFEVAMTNLRIASKRALSLRLLHREPLIKGALSGCSELTEMAISDLQRSVDKFIHHEFGTLARILNDVLFWVSGAMTYQETCLDGFVYTHGLVGQHMRLALKTGMELTTNALAMMTHVASRFESSIEKTATIHINRRLKSMARFPEWLDSNKRRLLEDNQGNLKADLVVAQDGSGKYTTINEALWDIPKHSHRTFVLYIKEGVYYEQVQFNSSMTNVMLVGDGPRKTRISGSLNFIDGTTTYRSATVAVSGDYFIAKDIGFENTAGPEKHQAVALRVGADRSIFYNCQMDGYQDTLYTHTYRQFYRDCVISGTVDFVFGDAAAVFQNCTFLIRKPMDNQQCIVTAQGRRNIRQPTGLVFQNCTIIGDSSLQPVKNKFRSYLGRPWKEYSRTVIMESFIGDVIQPDGFLPWNGTFALDTLFYTEFNNRGPGSNKDKRVKWPGIVELSPDRIQRFTASKFIEGDSWVPSSKVPYASGLIYEPRQQTESTPVSAEENADSSYMNIRDSYNPHNNLTSSPPLPTPTDSSPPAPVSVDQGSSTSPAADNSASPAAPMSVNQDSSAPPAEDNSASRAAPAVPSTDTSSNSASRAAPAVPSSDTSSNSASRAAPAIPSTDTRSNSASRPAPTVPSTDTRSNSASRAAPAVPSTDTRSNSASRAAPAVPSTDTRSNSASRAAPAVPSTDTRSNSASRAAPAVPSSDTSSNSASRAAPTIPSTDTRSNSASRAAPAVPSTDTRSNSASRVAPAIPSTDTRSNSDSLAAPTVPATDRGSDFASPTEPTVRTTDRSSDFASPTEPTTVRTTETGQNFGNPTRQTRPSKGFDANFAFSTVLNIH